VPEGAGWGVAEHHGMPGPDDGESEWHSTPQQWQRVARRAREMRHLMTPAEAKLWQHLRGAKLGVRFRRQHVLGPFVVDLYCSARKLIVEVDGPVHAGTTERDAERDAYLRSRGFRIVRFTNRDVATELERVLEAIRREL